MDDDLTTDACPSPPRDEKEKIETIQTSKLPKDQQVPPKVTTSSTSGRYKNQNFRKPNPNANKTKCDNVIYISKSKDIHIGSTTTYTINVGGSNVSNNENFDKPKEPTIHQTDKIKKILCSEEPVDRKHLIFVSGHITASNWKLMARKFGYSEGEIEHFFADHHTFGIKEVIYQCLLDWIQRKPDKATLGVLTDVLWTCNELEAVDIFSHYIYPDKSK